MKPLPLLYLLPLLMSCFSFSHAAENMPEVPVLWLENEEIRAAISPGFGGRVLQFGLRGQDNILLVGDEALRRKPHPRPESAPGHVPYLGHIVWAGPQSEWWIHQTVDAARKQEASVWPPDPYLVLGENKVVEHTQDQVLLEGEPSPISGLRLRKSFALVDGQANAMDLRVEAFNVREEPVAWDIWFNTRVRTPTRVYVPVAKSDDLRVMQLADEKFSGLDYALEDGLFSLALTAPPNGRVGRKGKAFIQPCAGWMAGFTDTQLFLISFPLQAREAIHPEQGQVEIYLEWLQDSPAAGVQEMEVHAPYRRLAPGDSMSASERWYLFPYDGPATREAHSAFLRKVVGRGSNDLAGC